MKVAVFDTYIRKPGGTTLHFDIIVPKEASLEQVLAYGRSYIDVAAPGGQISSSECQFCHIEEPTPDMLSGIATEGYFILGLDEIPVDLPDRPTRRQLIEHIRARSEDYRFADFKGVPEEKLWEIIQQW